MVVCRVVLALLVARACAQSTCGFDTLVRNVSYTPTVLDSINAGIMRVWTQAKTYMGGPTNTDARLALFSFGPQVYHARYDIETDPLNPILMHQDFVEGRRLLDPEYAYAIAVSPPGDPINSDFELLAAVSLFVRSSVQFHWIGFLKSGSGFIAQKLTELEPRNFVNFRSTVQMYNALVVFQLGRQNFQVSPRFDCETQVVRLPQFSSDSPTVGPLNLTVAFSSEAPFGKAAYDPRIFLTFVNYGLDLIGCYQDFGPFNGTQLSPFGSVPLLNIITAVDLITFDLVPTPDVYLSQGIEGLLVVTRGSALDYDTFLIGYDASCSFVQLATSPGAANLQNVSTIWSDVLPQFGTATPSFQFSTPITVRDDGQVLFNQVEALSNVYRQYNITDPINDATQLCEQTLFNASIDLTQFAVAHPRNDSVLYARSYLDAGQPGFSSQIGATYFRVLQR